MPICRPRNTRQPVLVERAEILAGDLAPCPESGRSRPAIVISSVDLPEPDGPTRPVASPEASDKETPLRIWTRAAARPRLRWTSCNSIAGAGLFAHRDMILISTFDRRPPLAAIRGPSGAKPRRAPVAIWARSRACPIAGRGFSAVAGSRLLPVATMTQAQTTPSGAQLKLVALGDSLTRRLRPAGQRGLPARAGAGAAPEGRCRSRSPMPASPATPSQGGLERLDWSVPDGTDGVILELGANDALRGLDPGRDRKGAGCDHHPAEGAQHRRCCWPACMRRAISATDYAGRFDAIYPAACAEAWRWCSTRSSWRASPGDRPLNQPDLLHPTAEGVRVIVQNILPTRRALHRDAAGQILTRRHGSSLLTVVSRRARRARFPELPRHGISPSRPHRSQGLGDLPGHHDLGPAEHRGRGPSRRWTMPSTRASTSSTRPKCTRSRRRAETQGSTERIIGNWFKARGNRDKVILASKIVGRGGQRLVPRRQGPDAGHAQADRGGGREEPEAAADRLYRPLPDPFSRAADALGLEPDALQQGRLRAAQPTRPRSPSSSTPSPRWSRPARSAISACPTRAPGAR